MVKGSNGGALPADGSRLHLNRRNRVGARWSSASSALGRRCPSRPIQLNLSANVVERLDTAVLLRELAVKELNALGELL